MDLTTDLSDRPLPPHLSGLPAGVDRLSRDVIASHHRDRVLVAAIEVFAIRGYRATTIDDLTAAAHIGVGSFYALFDGKQGCLLCAYDRIIVAVSERIAAALPAADVSWSERTRVALEALLAWIAAEPLAARIVLVEAQAAGPAALARYQATLQRLASLLHEGRAHSSTGGRLPASFEYATVTGVAWLLQERLVRGETSEIEALLLDLVEIVARPYLEGGETQTIQDAPGLEPGHRSAVSEAGAFMAQAGSAP